MAEVREVSRREVVLTREEFGMIEDYFFKSGPPATWVATQSEYQKKSEALGNLIDEISEKLEEEE